MLFAWVGHRWRAWERSVRSLVVWGAFIVLALFYLVGPLCASTFLRWLCGRKSTSVTVCPVVAQDLRHVMSLQLVSGAQTADRKCSGGSKFGFGASSRYLRPHHGPLHKSRLAVWSARPMRSWPWASLLQTATDLLRQIPIGAVQALLAVDALEKNPVAHFFLHAPVLDSLITAILPSALPTHIRCLCTCMMPV